MFLARGQPSTGIERAILIASIAILAGGAWLTLWTSSSSGGRHHHNPQSVFVFTGLWIVMTIAMMLPTTFPVVSIFHAVARERSDRALLVALVVAGYVAVWAIFGVGAYAGQRALQATGGAVLENIASPGLLLLAGAFQFSSLKYKCLEKCRSPFSFVVEHWQGRDHRRQALRLGAWHGLFCVGCCWALMLLMFAVGTGSLAWMLLLAAVMAVEKNVPWGRRVSAPVGIALLAWGAVLLVQAWKA